METTRLSWTARAEDAIRALKGVEDVRILAEGEEIRELHVLTTSNRPARLIVRDVQTLLLTRFDRSIDHRVVSVAHIEARGGPARPVASAARTPDPEPEPEVEDDGRIRFGSVNLYVAGARAQAQVELRWKGVPRMGSASGWCTREAAHGLIASATLAALQEYLSDDIALGVEDVEMVRVGRHQVVVVTLALIAHRQEKVLAGCCTVGQDVQQAVVLATLAALNRVVGGLKTREPIEYVLRPAST
ncbi:MAG: hypothetical protein HZC42_13340 [Candidatus Eisenbacteria bacterium]|nr:hypothetical protein [Candidatus Eisenbacteria bacterium]